MDKAKSTKLVVWSRPSVCEKRKQTNQTAHPRLAIHEMMLVPIALSGGVIFVCGKLLISHYSPGTPEPFLDETGNTLPDSLAEKIRVTINGAEQGMFIKSKNYKTNPVLLFVHGGPGMPEYWLTEFYPESRRIEDTFTVVWWEQRGAGLSYDPKTKYDSMTAQQFVSDTLAVTKYLRDRFAKDKVYMLAHSWGSYIGIQAAAQEPDLYHVYIGMGQIVHQIKSEQLAFGYAIEAYQREGNQKMVQRLKAAPPTTTVPLPDSYMALRDEYMHGIGIGTTRKMASVIYGIFLPSWRFRGGYTLLEKVNLWRGKLFSRSTSLWDEMLETDLVLKVPRLSIPVYFLHGKHDYTCAYPLAKEYFAKIQAPVKGFYTFQESAHSPIFEEPGRTLEILLKDVLPGTTDLAD